MSHQQERFASFLKKEIARFLAENVLRGENVFISVTNVIATERADSADVFISIFPPEEAKNIFKSIKFMERATRKYIASRSKRQFIPRMRFLLDESWDKEAHLEKLLEKVKNE